MRWFGTDWCSPLELQMQVAVLRLWSRRLFCAVRSCPYMAQYGSIVMYYDNR